MEFAVPWNIEFFYWINATDTSSVITINFAKGLAIFTPWIVIVILIVCWLAGSSITRKSLMIVGVALGVGLAINFSIAFLVYVPRPFEVGIGRTLLSHGLETSFPSDHATFLWALGFGILIDRQLRKLGIVISLLALGTSWARIYLGVHFPLDMFASVFISLFATLLACWLSSHLNPILFEPVENIYQFFVKSLKRKKSRK